MHYNRPARMEQLYLGLVNWAYLGDSAKTQQYLTKLKLHAKHLGHRKPPHNPRG